MLEVEDLGSRIWEPANGFGAISEVLAETKLVFTSDIYRWSKSTQYVRDFCSFQKLPKLFCKKGIDIITNPPFSQAQEFVETAQKILPIGNKLCLLLRLQFLEGQKRYKLFESFPIKTVHVFSFRLPRMHTFYYRGKESGSVLAFAWFCWQQGYKGNTIINFIPPRTQLPK